MNWRRFWRNFARFWMGFVLITDFILYTIMVIDTDNYFYYLANSFNWAVTPSWIAVTYPTIIAMLWLTYDVIFHDRQMGAIHFGFLTIISLMWTADLFFYETLILNQYNWSKIADGLRWLSFFFAAWYYKFRSSPWS